MLDMSNRIDHSRVVAYASIDTNDVPNSVLIVSEVWKGASEASLFGITNGAHLPFRFPAAVMAKGHFPDHAIVIFSRAVSRSGRPTTSNLVDIPLYIYNDRTTTFNMTVQEYRAKFGL